MDNAFNIANGNQAAQGQMVPYAGPMAGPGMGSDSLFHILWKSWWVIVLLSAVGVGGAFLYLKELAPEPLYTSTARLLVEKPSLRQTDIGVVHDVGAESRNLHQTQATVIMSRQILNLALNDADLLTLASAADPNYLGDLVSTLSARVAKDADIINVSASAPHADDAARFVNAVVRAYRGWHERNRAVGTSETLQELYRQQTEYQNQLERKREALRNLEARREAATGDVGVRMEKLEILKQQVASARATAEEFRVYYEQLQHHEEDPQTFRQYAIAHQPAQGFTLDDRQRIRLEDELRATQVQLDAIQAGAVAKHSQIARLQERTVELEQEIEQFDKEFVSNHLSLVKMSMEDKVSRAERLTQLYSEERGNIQQSSSIEGEYNDLLTDVRNYEDLRNSVTRQISQLEMQTPEGLSIHVLEDAVPAGKPDSVQTARVLGIGLVAGMMLGSGLAFVRDWRDQRVRSADEITAILGVPVLGAIPKIRRFVRSAEGEDSEFSMRSRASEACRAIRTALFFGTPQHQAVTLLVTSGSSREGKTTLVSNLGVAMAKAGQRTLIIDGDLRKPMQHRVFAANHGGKGLTDLLAGTGQLDATIRTTKVQGLDVLPSGENVRNPSELLSGPRFEALLEELKERYDRIIIDSPPVGLVTDGQILAAMCDLTLIVLRARHSTRQFTQRTRDALQTVGARIAGAVVNDVSKRDKQYSHYSGYGYYYGVQTASNKTTEVRNLPVDIAASSKDTSSAPGPNRGESPSLRN
ncbi:MAG: polysaccharide biosynthesis tyrosine autokinase [Planctomycetota bacterium]|jgi:capsular exopolysaccharide synthesis family protein|nr:polysaccharide biosynthesis tyrosine autokinase [Planctomycetota bacterium]